MQTTCGQHFADWIEYFSKQPGIWIIRDLERDLVWRNDLWRKWLGKPESILPTSENRAQQMTQETARLIEDKQSLALKTGKIVTADALPMEIDGLKVDVMAVYKASVCQCCERRCRVIIVRLCPARVPNRLAV